MRRIAAGILAAVLAAAGFADSGAPRAGRVAKPVVRIAQGDACVAPTEQMRREHMKLLLHQRDRTMHQGLRERRFSLKGCVECHASRDTGSVLGDEGFCASCHAYAAVRIDCFECHTPLRPARSAGASR
jgi:hypothetical protein